jgi:DNA-binding LacI/PurR family transcriptional regulator
MQKPHETTKPKSVTKHMLQSSRGLVSTFLFRVLNDKDDVSVETYEKVQHNIERCNMLPAWRPGQRSHRTNVIGIGRL